MKRGDAVPSVVKLYELAKFLDMFMCELIDIKNRKNDILLKGIEGDKKMKYISCHFYPGIINHHFTYIT